MMDIYLLVNGDGDLDSDIEGNVIGIYSSIEAVLEGYKRYTIEEFGKARKPWRGLMLYKFTLDSERKIYQCYLSDVIERYTRKENI